MGQKHVRPEAWEIGAGAKISLCVYPVPVCLLYAFWLRLGVDPRLSVVATEQLVGVRVTDDTFVLAIPFDAASDL